MSFLEVSELENLLFHQKPLKILLGLKYAGGRSYTSLLAKYADCTYSHATFIIDKLVEQGVLQYEKKGRIKYVTLTEKGEEIVFLLEQLYRKIK